MTDEDVENVNRICIRQGVDEDEAISRALHLFNNLTKAQAEGKTILLRRPTPWWAFWDSHVYEKLTIQ